ncbi:phosphopantothenoylcysteine synthetase [Capsaspora owczarzaki ATCC 30864]|uniref:Phosphopantothenoylcysteine synthetase n=1 Tax=Capsaspora owczarzaki (strain ATCC 30864) TaxID=595528 RepID=A0A0D2WUE5_CAPO3|nr:phosphopantothenoylcysteine synthetase [Capsaspora owczarzaki ATCC 30864]KJE95538.1 phosphopantothenoylcysteine synthetase [Capsaspora owczarzaki ATCC 30864]|eukprot:XP_004345577.1 phosphopantothenoylcysteine synthetase [Capsaspora owczarzaki ATCC 30864]
MSSQPLQAPSSTTSLPPSDLHPISWEEYFATTPAPESLDAQAARMAAFVAQHRNPSNAASSRRIFIEKGYAVIFLHRVHTLEPYARHFTPRTLLEVVQPNADGSLAVRGHQEHLIRECVTKYHRVVKEQLLLQVPFTTVTDYLFLLREAAKILGPLGPEALLYLAAAVSDFFIPAAQMAQHKIQSGTGALTLTLQQVPKLLKPLVKEWVPQAFVVSFKLETDPDIVADKARAALRNYGHSLVISNLLNTRKYAVTLVTADTAQEIRLSEAEIGANVEIEDAIVAEVKVRHEAFILRGTK